jgi:hypothetical protein
MMECNSSGSEVRQWRFSTLFPGAPTSSVLRSAKRSSAQVEYEIGMKMEHVPTPTRQLSKIHSYPHLVLPMSVISHHVSGFL